LFFKHPYELYMIHQHLSASQPLQPQDYLVSPKLIGEYDARWSALPSIVRSEFEDKAQRYLLEYNAVIHRAILTTHLSEYILLELVAKQFENIEPLQPSPPKLISQMKSIKKKINLPHKPRKWKK
jgi:hypothetical protein